MKILKTTSNHCSKCGTAALFGGISAIRNIVTSAGGVNNKEDAAK